MTRAATTLPHLSHDLESERCLLGAILLDPTALDRALDLVATHELYSSSHQKIFAAMLDLSETNEPIDSITLAERLRVRGDLEAVGGVAYLAELVHAAPSAANIAAYCRIVRQKAQRRGLIRLGSDLQARAQDEQAAISELLGAAERDIFALQYGTFAGSDKPLSETVKERLSRLQYLQQRGLPVTGLSTGFGALDSLTAGLQPGNLVVIGARPGQGKTSLALNIASHVAVDQHLPTQIFSMEMSRDELADRLLSAAASVDAHAFRTGKIESQGWWRLAEASERLASSPLFIDDSGDVTITQIRSRCRRRKAKSGLSLVIVDYLQLMAVDRRGESRQQEISDISRSLKGLAKELNVPVIALSQLSRAVESRNPPIPVLADLRESGAIEQDADAVMFIYREEMYEPQSEKKGIAEILIRKHRNGPTGDRKLLFIERFARFEDLDQ